MRKYEVMVILDPSLEDKDAKAAVDRYLKTITSRDSKVLEVDHWGKRRFAYEIRHINEGYYTVVTIEAETETVDEFSRVLGLADNVIRHKIVRPEAVA
jgi:small subunit ribosomal protein S6